MNPKEKKTVCAALIAVLVAAEEEKNSKKRKLWTREWIRRRPKQGCYENLLREMALEDKEGYRRWLRMSTSDFEYLLEKVAPIIQKKNTNMREAIPAAERLALTLRYLAAGETQSSLSFQFRVAQNTISGILPAVCDALYQVLKEDYLAVPNTEQKWLEISSQFEKLWNFPLCIGAMDGKHIKISPPPGSGSTYYNYKGDFSIVLLALVDANLKFIYVDVGTNGRISDGGVWGKSSLKKALDTNALNIPRAGILPKGKTKATFVIVADDAFPLTQNIMKPYPGKSLTQEKRIFNYRLSRARRVSENAFGILASRFQIFRSSINASPVKVQKMVLATCALHNFLKMRQDKLYTPARSLDTEDVINCTFTQGDFRNDANGMRSMKKIPTKSSNSAKEIQDLFCNYFNKEGAVPWQNEMCKLH